MIKYRVQLVGNKTEFCETEDVIMMEETFIDGLEKVVIELLRIKNETQWVEIQVLPIPSN